MFISFEGLDFSGKSTQAKLLVERLRQQHHTVHFIREPGGTVISEKIRDILLDKNHLEMSDAAEILLFSASRSQLVRQVINPALQRGEIVVCDRYCDSTTAYQGYGRGLNLDDVRTINRFATGSTMPDLTILVDIPIEEIERRKTQAGLSFDRMESAGRAFYERVRHGYHTLAAGDHPRWFLVDGMLSIETIEKEIRLAVDKKLAATNRSEGHSTGE
ncbi:MAG: dTMP kinase [Bacteroidetes bacterium]|nr:dTMP kinase [Bacteroidota bacterium]MCW5894639.1 dTMP kinase [Bacteroidota bacterium]